MDGEEVPKGIEKPVECTGLPPHRVDGSCCFTESQHGRGNGITIFKNQPDTGHLSLETLRKVRENFIEGELQAPYGRQIHMSEVAFYEDIDELRKAVKKDDGKERYDLVPPFAMSQIAKVFTFGASKYSDRNWEKGLAYGRVFAAALRHCWSFWRGETHDPETELHHMAHAAVCCMFLVEYSDTGKGEDDRP